MLFVLSISLLIVVFDQLTKYFVSRYMALSQSVSLIDGILHLTYIQNTGAGFGMLKGWNIVLIFVSLIVIGLMLYYFDRIVKGKAINIPVALVLGGAIGNLVDRVLLGHVIDFIDFRIWPAFNIADSCITIGSMWLIVYFWKK